MKDVRHTRSTWPEDHAILRRARNACRAAMCLLASFVLAVSLVPIGALAPMPGSDAYAQPVAAPAAAQPAAPAAAQPAAAQPSDSQPAALATQADDDGPTAADRKAAQKVIDLIDDLPDPDDIPTDDLEAAQEALDAATEAQEAYDDLTPEQQDLVDNADRLQQVLEAAEQAVAQAEQLEADREAAQAVIELIDELPDPDDIPTDDLDAANAARESAYAAQDAYDDLTSDQQNLVTNADRLQQVVKAAENAVKEAEKAEEARRKEAEEEEARKKAEEEEAARKAAEEEAERKAAEEEERRKAEEEARQKAEQGGDDAEDPDDDTHQSSKKRTLEDMDVYVTETNSYGEWGAELPRKNKGTRANPEYWLRDGIKEKGGQVKLLVYAYWSGGRACRQDDRDDWLDLDLEYDSSDKKVATVSNSGIVTATGDGEVEISVTDRDTGISNSIYISVSGQAGPLVEEVWVCDASGRQYEEERIVYNDFTEPLQLFAREVFSDGSSASNAPDADDYDPDALTELSWTVNNDMARISAGEGSLTATKEAREAATTAVTVTLTATGGDPDVREGLVRSTAYVRIQGTGTPTSGRYAADSLTVKVIYDKYPDHTVATKTWSLDELKALETVQSTYTLTRSNGAYATASGTGIYLVTIIDQMGLDASHVKSFTFTANDGVNPGKMTYAFLFGERYWWPNYEFGQNRADAQLVFPMLAWESDWRENADTGADYSNLNDNARLRLLFGSETNSDNKTDHSLKYISAMTIRIDGAPDATSGEGEKGEAGTGDGDADDGTSDESTGETGDDPASETDPAKPADPASDASQPAGSPDAQPAADGNGDSAAAAAPGANGNGPAGPTVPNGPNAANANANGATGAAGTSDAATDDERQRAADGISMKSETDASAVDTNQGSWETVSSPQQEQSQEQSAEQAADVAQSESASQKWRVYQMLNPFDQVDMQIDDLAENPLDPFLFPAVLLLLVLGGLERFLNYRMQMIPFAKASAA